MIEHSSYYIYGRISVNASSTTDNLFDDGVCGILPEETVLPLDAVEYLLADFATRLNTYSQVRLKNAFFVGFFWPRGYFQDDFEEKGKLTIKKSDR